MVALALVATGRNRHFAPSSSPATKSPPLTKGGPHHDDKEGSLNRGASLRASSGRPSVEGSMTRQTSQPSPLGMTAPLCRGRDHTPGSFAECIVEPFRRGGSHTVQIQPVCILRRGRDIVPCRLGGGTAPGCLA
jgi:hypothetical protein